MREKILFDEKWMFHRGDIDIEPPKDKGPVYAQAKVQRKMWGPASRAYNAWPNNYGQRRKMEICTHKWEWINLPHDYIISQIPSRDENNALGYYKYENAWYRKIFNIPEDDKNKRITLFFEGVATHATVYLNGCLLKHNYCGYTSFEVDLTDHLKFGDEENVIAVYVETDEHEGWWYEGAGIYRHVWLCKTDNVAVDLWGVYVAPKKVNDTDWKVKTETTIRNDRYEDVTAEFVTTFYDKDKNAVATASGKTDIPKREKKTAIYYIDVKNPELWDIDSPNLYDVETKVYVDGVECDRYETRTGFRTVEIYGDKGLFLNGKYVKIKGVCTHQDFGLTGKAVADNIHRYKIEMIKEMGANGYRTSHYPHSESTMDALDELGFIVMDETRWYDSSVEGCEQLEMLVKRDRNRPSVVFWSLGNEEPHHTTEEGRRICKNLYEHLRKLDDTRFIMTAVSNSPDEATVYDELDALGINYNHGLYEHMHEKFPTKGIFASECCATGTTRGWYDPDCPEKAFLSAYDKDTDNWFIGRERMWKFINKYDWILGGYQWTAFEFRGTASWPRLCSQAGAIDLFMQKKDAFYQNQCHWIEDRALVHLLPHWNFKGREGEVIPVWAYTNCEEVELFLNGKSLGRKVVEKYGHGKWMVEYEPGKITVEAINGGKVVCSETHETTGRAEKLMLKLDNTITEANGTDVAVITCYCVDSEGREVPDAAPNFVSFHTNGLGTVIATGSDISDHVPPYYTNRRMRAGRITVAVRVGKTAGTLRVYANSDNLETGVLKIDLK